jgi:dTDP-4-dehydrorhamnose 3,5-epimerase
MRFSPTHIAGVAVVDLEPVADDRGFFARLHCPDEFAEASYPFTPVQTSLSRNHAAHTLRGLHYQTGADGEAKLVRVVRGRAFDVAVDLRPDSLTHRKWTAVELSAENGKAILVPHGVAHGFLTLEPDTDILYQIDQPYRPGREQGARWDDAAFAIAWPDRPAVISDRDAAYPDYEG